MSNPNICKTPSTSLKQLKPMKVWHDARKFHMVWACHYCGPGQRRRGGESSDGAGRASVRACPSLGNHRLMWGLGEICISCVFVFVFVLLLLLLFVFVFVFVLSHQWYSQRYCEDIISHNQSVHLREGLVSKNSQNPGIAKIGSIKKNVNLTYFGEN